MFRLSVKIVLLFVAIIVIVAASGLLLKDVEHILLKKAAPFALIILIVAAIFWKNETRISLKFFAPVHNKIIVFPAILLLFTYSAWASEWFTTQSNSIGFVLGLTLVVYLQTFWEELIFRGILLNHYLKKDLSATRSVVYSSIIFAFLHLINLANNPSVISVLNQVLFSVIMGIFLGAMYMLCRNIYLMGLVHGLINFPSYANKYQHDAFVEPDIAQELMENTSLLESLIGTILFLLIYSPFLIVGIAMLQKVKHDLAKTPLTTFTEYAFKPFSQKK